MEDTCIQEGDIGFWGAFGGHVQMLSASEGSKVGGPTNTLGGLHTVNQI